MRCFETPSTHRRRAEHRRRGADAARPARRAGDSVRVAATRSTTQPRAVIGVTTSGAREQPRHAWRARELGANGKPGRESGYRRRQPDRVGQRCEPSSSSSADVGDYDMANVMTRRLTRELDKLHPGDEVDLRVYANGQTKVGEGEDRRARRISTRPPPRRGATRSVRRSGSGSRRREARVTRSACS